MWKVARNIRDLVLSTFLFSLACIILGAPMTEQYLQTVSVGILLTFFTTLPIIIFDELSVDRISAVYFKPSDSRERFLAFIGCGSVLGAWSSASLLILDWDRPWQAWPYPCVVGSLTGASTGFLLCIFYPFLRRIWSTSQCPAWCSPLTQYVPLGSDVKVRVN